MEELPDRRKCPSHVFPFTAACRDHHHHRAHTHPSKPKPLFEATVLLGARRDEVPVKRREKLRLPLRGALEMHRAHWVSKVSTRFLAYRSRGRDMALAWHWKLMQVGSGADGSKVRQTVAHHHHHHHPYLATVSRFESSNQAWEESASG